MKRSGIAFAATLTVFFCLLVPIKCVPEKLALTDCSQSSTTAGGDCQRAIDGNANQNYGAGSCTHTNSERGWWRAKTRKLSRFTSVRIHNRMDCCSERLNDFAILVDGFVCATFYSTGFFPVQTFQCNKVGQVLTIENRKDSPLTLCEVEAFGETVELPPPAAQLPLTQCSQSSTTNDAPCVRAIDGNTDQNWGHGSCIHTADEHGWWQAQTRKKSNIRHVRIYNRMDCCSERLNDFTILVDGQECASYRSHAFFGVQTFDCNVVGEVVRIASRKHTSLNFCEVQVFGEEIIQPSDFGQRLPLGQCSQSSTTHGAGCQRAIDGRTDQDWGRGSCIHTSPERGWWEARTEKLAKITHVRVYNRLDCCSDSLTDFAITVDGQECAAYKSDRFFGMETFECNQVGQVVRIINRRPTSLMFCEVQVFGSPVEMAVNSKQLRLSHCSQSSTTHGAGCERAIDGIKSQGFGENSCTHTADEKSWWQAKIQRTAFITHVRIYNRLDCCSDRLNDISIIVGGHECAAYQSDGFFSVKTFECNYLGQVVRIESHKAVPLTLCEVEVFGEDNPR